VKNFDSQASDFILEMLDIYGYAPLDELRDENSNEITEVAKEINFDGVDESYDFMKDGIRPDILYVTDTAKEVQEALALLEEKRDIRAVSRKEIGEHNDSFCFVILTIIFYCCFLFLFPCSGFLYVSCKCAMKSPPTCSGWTEHMGIKYPQSL
jgi:hypothetical protein